LAPRVIVILFSPSLKSKLERLSLESL